MKLGANEHILPLGARVIHFSVDPKVDKLMAWIAHTDPTEQTMHSLQRFDVIATGQEYNGELWEPIRTFVDERSGLVWHLLVELKPNQPQPAYTERSVHAEQ